MKPADRARLTRYATGRMRTDTHSTFEDGRFSTRWVAKVGSNILAIHGQPFRFATQDEAREFGRRFQRIARAVLANRVTPNQQSVPPTGAPAPEEP